MSVPRQLFDREASLIVGAVQTQEGGAYEGRNVSGLRLSFRVSKSLDSKPNTIDLSVWNLGAETRAATSIENAKVLLSAGYKGATRLLFLGDVDLVTHERKGVDWVTRVQAGDGMSAARVGRLFEAIAPGELMKEIVPRMVGQMKVGMGNALTALKKGKAGVSVTQLTNGMVLDGFLDKRFDAVARAFGFERSVQDDQLLLTQRGRPDEREAFVLALDSGLVGSPVVAVKETQTGRRNVVRCKSLLNADISPGRALRVEGAALQVWCRVESVAHTGDTHGSDWYTEIEATPL